jgi:hypothetical protein
MPVGFWDGDTLITWTSNVQGWFTHGSWEYSSRMQLTVRDLYDRPRARIWEEYFERGMKRPAKADDLGGFK